MHAGQHMLPHRRRGEGVPCCVWSVLGCTFMHTLCGSKQIRATNFRQIRVERLFYHCAKVSIKIHYYGINVALNICCIQNILCIYFVDLYCDKNSVTFHEISAIF